MRVIDGFTFNDELDILELRLNELYEHIDRFILVESTTTFTGNKKPLHFAENKERFREFSDKIIHIIVDDTPDTSNPWEREYYQRNAIARGMTNFDVNDIIFISDVDEIIRGDSITRARNTSSLYHALRMPLFYFKFNYLNTAGEAMAVWSIGVHGTVFTTPQGIRNLRLRLSGLQSATPVPGLMIHDHAGWHFSYLGDKSRIIRKIESFSHQEFNTDKFKSELDIDDILRQGKDLFNRPGYHWSPILVDEYFPSYLTSQKERFSSNIITQVQHRLTR